VTKKTTDVQANLRVHLASSANGITPDVFGDAARRGDFDAVFSQAGDMETDRLAEYADRAARHALRPSRARL